MGVYVLSIKDTNKDQKGQRYYLAQFAVILFMIFGWGICTVIASTVTVSADGKSLYCGNDSGRVYVWNISRFQLDRVLDVSSNVETIALSPNGKTLLTISNKNGDYVFWDAIRGDRLYRLGGGGELRTGYEGVTSVAFSPDGLYIASSSRADITMNFDYSSAERTSDGYIRKVPMFDDSVDASHSVILWNSKDRKLLRYIRGHKNDVNAIAFSPDSQFLLTGSSDGTAKLWSVKTGEIEETIDNQPEGVSEVAFSADGHRIALGRGDGSIIFWDRQSSSVLWETPAYSQSLSSIACSRDDRFVLSGYGDGTSILWDATQGTRVSNLSQLSGPLSVTFLPTNRHAVIATEDGDVDIWDLSSWKYVTLKAEGDDWVCFTPEGFFAASRRGGQLVSVVNGLDVYGIDQFATKYNRPDIIMENLGLGSKEMISHFYQYHLKRLRRSGFTEEQLKVDLHVPEVLIRDMEQSEKIVELTFDMKDDKYNLKKYNIYINDVPIFGSYGKEIVGNSISKTQRIELTQGKNKIEITCINEAGAESHRALTYANYNKEVKGDLYYIGFGVSKYKNKSLNLAYADKDARDLSAIFSKMKAKFNNVYINIYLNEEVTIKNIKKAKDFLKKASVDDTFILFIAGHGVYDQTGEATYYYLTHNADIDNISETAANFDLIEDLLQGIAPRNKLFLMDTCESGEIDEDVQDKYYAMANNRGVKARTTRAITVKSKNKGRYSRDYLYQKDRFIYNDLQRRSGAIVFSSSKGGEFSYESDKIGNGFFTEEIINALTKNVADKDRNGVISIYEIIDYVSNAVAKQTENKQHPTVDRDNIYQKFGLPMIR